ncbi:MAG: hypothetical protein M1820_010600 [Bogoriella megaspora]|nr:MAG: hypothetical protein M1820_010600 [Bogoriella megaspora]
MVYTVESLNSAYYETKAKENQSSRPWYFRTTSSSESIPKRTTRDDPPSPPRQPPPSPANNANKQSRAERIAAEKKDLLFRASGALSLYPQFCRRVSFKIAHKGEGMRWTTQGSRLVATASQAVTALKRNDYDAMEVRVQESAATSIPL